MLFRSPVISGPTTVNSDASGVVYTVPFIAGHLYSWTIVGGEITDGQGTHTITVNWDWAACQDCPSSICVTETSNFSSTCVGQTCITVTQIPVPGAFTLSGQVTYDNASHTPLNGVTIQLVNSSNVVVATTTTSTMLDSSPAGYTAGSYSFTGLFSGNYTLRASTTKAWAGANATDALVIKLATNHNPNLIGLPIYAADVNASNTITATDALLVQLRYVRLINSFTAGDWTFGSNPVTIAGASLIYNFKGLVMGDVNKSNVPDIGYQPNIYNNLQKEGVIQANSQEFELPVRVSDVMSLGAVSLDMLYNQTLVDVTGLTSQLSGLEYNISNGSIRIAWANTNPSLLQANDVLFTLKVKAKDAISNTTDIFSMSNTSEFADENGNIISSLLKVNSIVTDSKNCGISVYPNPFKDNAVIDYNLIESGNVKIALYNCIGQRVQVLVDEYKTAGNYKFNFNTSDLPSGVYSCEIIINGQTSDFKKVIKLVRTK